MASDVTINSYINEICMEIDNFINIFINVDKPTNLFEYIKFIDTYYPFIQIVYNMDYTDSCYIKQIFSENEDIYNKADQLLQINTKTLPIIFPSLHINELNYNILKFKQSNGKSCNIYILDLMYDLTQKSYKFFDNKSPKKLIELLNSEEIYKCIDTIIINITNDIHISTAIRNINYSMQKFLETDNGSLCEGYPQIVRMAILIWGRRLLHYDIFQSWFTDNRKIIAKSKLLSSTTSSEGASILHWYMTFYVMESIYNDIFDYEYYDTDLWND